jgi:hypothetical protein
VTPNPSIFWDRLSELRLITAPVIGKRNKA